jgi:hypothetical protein
MGLSSSTTRTTNTPSPQQTQAGNTLNSVFGSQLPRIQGYADQIGGLMPGMIDRYNAGDAGVNASRDWITRTLGQQGENPHLQGMIDQTGGDISRQVGAGMGSRGNWGGSVHEKMLANALARSSMGMRYNDYSQQQQRQAQAAGMAPGVAAADTIQIAPLLAAAGYAGGAPLAATSQYASGMGGLFGNTGTQSTTQSPSILGMLLQAGSNAAQAAAMGSDIRLKEDIRRVGQTDGGLPVYTYRYKGNPVVHMGVMAQEVAQSQPEALGPLINGEYMSVKYGEVR